MVPYASLSHYLHARCACLHLRHGRQRVDFFVSCLGDLQADATALAFFDLGP